MDDLLVRGGLIVLRWREDALVLQDAALLLREGKIIEHGPFANLQIRNPQANVVGDGTHLVIPGFINAHSHGRGLSTITRGVPDQPIESRVPLMRTLRSVDPYWDTLLSCVRQLEHGITSTMHVDSYYGGDSNWHGSRFSRVLSAYAASGIRFSLTLGIRDQHAFAYIDDQIFLDSLPEHERRVAIESLLPTMSSDDYLRLYDHLADRVPGSVLQFGPINPVWCSDDLLGRISEAAQQRGARVHIHLLETRYQREYALRKYGRTAVEHLASIGFFRADATCAHCVWVTEADLVVLRDAAALVVHNPSSNLRLGSGIAPVRVMSESGVRLAIGLDSSSLNDDEDMLEELRLAYVLHRLPQTAQGAPRALSALKILQWATEGGAESVGLENVGRLESGCLGDVVLIQVPASRRAMTPRVIAESLLNWPRDFAVDTVIVGGRVVVKDGRYAIQDRTEIESNTLSSLGQPQDRKDWSGDVRSRIMAVYGEWRADLDPFYAVNSRR